MTNNLKHIIMPDGTKLDLPTVNINDIELNNPFTFGMSQYYKGEMNNISWLKSNGEYHPKATYPSFYNWVLNNVNAGKYGFKLSTATDITDYDFVINTTNESFRLPLKNGDNIIFAPKEGSGSILETFTTSKANTWESSTLTAPVTGWYWTYGAGNITSSATRSLFLGKGANKEEWQSARSVGPQGRDLETNHIWLNKGETFIVSSVEVRTRITHYIEANIPNLYYYVGEIVQNADLIDAGRFGEELVDINSRPHIIETYTSESGNSWYEVWSDGKIKQGGNFAATTSDGEITFLKPFKTKILNYFSQARTGIPNSISIGLYGVDGSTDLKKVKYKVEASLLTGFDWEVIGY